MTHSLFIHRNLRALLRLGISVFLIALLTRSALAATAESVFIQGRVLNGSADLAQPVAGVEVSLYGITSDHKTLVGSAQTAGDGSFTFSGVAADPGQQFAASVTFDGVIYANAVARASGGAASDVTVTVYDTTSSTTAITFDRASMVIAGADAKTRLVTLVESYHITNNGNLTYIGSSDEGQRRSLRFPLFSGARSLVALDGFAADDATPTADGFSLASPVRPGQTAISFTYDVPYVGTVLTLRRSLPYAVALVEVILPGNVSVQSPQLNAHGSVQLAGRNFDTIGAVAPAAGTPLEVLLSGLPAASSAHSYWDSLPVRMASVLLVIGGIGLAVFLLRRRHPVRSVAVIRTERERLISEVAALDDQAQRAGRTMQTRYLAQRRRAIERLKTLTIQVRLAESCQEGTDSCPASAVSGQHLQEL